MIKKSSDLYNPETWEFLRDRYANSIMKDTELAILGQSLGISWPFKGSDETPDKYIQYSFEDLNSVPGLIGRKGRITTLFKILNGMLEFDDPFGDMADSVEAGNEIDDTFEKILNKFDIPGDYPASFVHLSEEAIELICDPDIETLLDIIIVAQRLNPDTDEAPDLRMFLNSLAHKDEIGICNHIPYRRGERGLHLAEAFGLIAADLDEAVQLELLHQYGDIMTEDEEALRKSFPSEEIEAQLASAVRQIRARCDYFKQEAAALRNSFHEATAPERFFIPIDDHRLERVSVSLARTLFGLADKQKTGLLGKLSGLFGK